jgi:hypothetical protein
LKSGGDEPIFKIGGTSFASGVLSSCPRAGKIARQASAIIVEYVLGVLIKVVLTEANLRIQLDFITLS